MPWAWQQNKVICDVCQESLTLEPHPPAQYCNEKHTAWACKVTEVKFRGKTIAWVCIGCAYTHDAQRLYGQSIHPFGQMWTWTTFTENTRPCAACREFAESHVTRHLPKVIRELRRQDRSEEAMEALRRLRDRDPERARERPCHPTPALTLSPPSAASYATSCSASARSSWYSSARIEASAES